MRPTFEHLALFVLLLLSLASTVALTLAHLPVPDVLGTVATATAGALFGITLPRNRSGGID